MKRKKMKIAVINGPNINLIGIREPHIYGLMSWKDIEEELRRQTIKLNIDLLFFQSNHEGDIVDFIQQNMFKFEGILINPAAFSKSGYSILESLLATNTPFVEVHMSNINARESWHSETIFSAKACGHINGFGKDSYYLGILALYHLLQNRKVKKENVNGKKIS